jgi:hypothetical protein
MECQYVPVHIADLDSNTQVQTAVTGPSEFHSSVSGYLQHTTSVLPCMNCDRDATRAAF